MINVRVYRPNVQNCFVSALLVESCLVGFCAQILQAFYCLNALFYQILLVGFILVEPIYFPFIYYLQFILYSLCPPTLIFSIISLWDLSFMLLYYYLKVLLYLTAIFFLFLFDSLCLSHSCWTHFFYMNFLFLATSLILIVLSA